MNKLFPLPLYTLARTSTQSGGFSYRAFRNLPAWMIKTILFEPLRWIELLFYNKKIRQHQLEKDPIFILGYYRSGTTYLQQTLAQDQRLGYLDLFQQIVPEIMLSTRYWLKPLLSSITGLLKAENKMHRTALSWDFPGEEDVAMTTGGCRASAYWGYFFPEKMDEYHRKYILFETASASEKKEWISNYKWLIKKISLANNGKQLILKTPPNLSRIEVLLTTFPNAKFIVIHRDPYEVFSSNKRLWKIVQEIYTIGKTEKLDVNQTIIDSYASMMEHYIREKNMVPPERLIEIRYSEFSADPVSTMQRIYEKLDLGDFKECQKRFADFAAAKKDYGVLQHKLTKTEIRLVNEHWSKFISYWNYQALE